MQQLRPWRYDLLCYWRFVRGRRNIFHPKDVKGKEKYQIYKFWPASPSRAPILSHPGKRPDHFLDIASEQTYYRHNLTTLPAVPGMCELLSLRGLGIRLRDTSAI